jgi:hypothetical protein
MGRRAVDLPAGQRLSSNRLPNPTSRTDEEREDQLRRTRPSPVELNIGGEEVDIGVVPAGRSLVPRGTGVETFQNGGGRGRPPRPHSAEMVKDVGGGRPARSRSDPPRLQPPPAAKEIPLLPPKNHTEIEFQPRRARFFQEVWHMALSPLWMVLAQYGGGGDGGSDGGGGGFSVLYWVVIALVAVVVVALVAWAISRARSRRT